MASPSFQTSKPVKHILTAMGFLKQLEETLLTSSSLLCSHSSAYRRASAPFTVFFSSCSSRDWSPTSHFVEEDTSNGDVRVSKKSIGEIDIGKSRVSDACNINIRRDIVDLGFMHKDGGNSDPRRVQIGDDRFRNHPMVKEFCRMIELRANWNSVLEGQLRHLLRGLKPSQVCAVLCSLSDERVALNIFYWADRQWRYRHDPVVYYSMLQILSRTKLCEGSRRILRLMVRRGIVLKPEAFSYVMISYSRAGEFRKAMGVFGTMQKTGIEPDLITCNTSIHVLVMGNMLDKAIRFLNRMQIFGIQPNVVSYNCLIKGYCATNRVHDALQLIDEMPSKGCLPDKASYYTVMGFFSKEKKIKDLRSLMEKMNSESGLFPDQVTYHTIIHILSKHGHGDEALTFLREAEAKGFTIDKVGYTAIVHSLCLSGHLNNAKELVNEMLIKGNTPDVVTYTSLINGLCCSGKLEEAQKLLHEMNKYGCRPNTVTYTALLNGLCRNGKSMEAREMMMMKKNKASHEEDELWKPNAITYSVVFHGLHRDGKISEACNLVSEMIDKGFFPTSSEINLLIQSLCQEGRINDAKNLMQECLNRGCQVNVVNFTTLINGFCRKGDLDCALSLLDDMYLCNKRPDTVTYKIIINALSRKGRVKEVAELTKQMLHKGLVPSSMTYSSIIHWFCKHGKVDDLLGLLEKMKFKTVYNQVIEKLCHFGNVDDGYKLLGKVLRTASRNDAKTCRVLMESYLKKGDPLLSYKVACRMFNRNLIPDLKLCEKVSERLRMTIQADKADKLMVRFVERGISL